MEFFRSYRMSDKAIALMANEMYEAVMSISLLLSQTLKLFENK